MSRSTFHRVRTAGLCVALLLLAACRHDAPSALGTLEYDRIALPAPAAERIVAIDVREGERVEAGARILSLEQVRGDAQLAVAEAEAARQRQLLEELRNGARREDIDQLRANLAAAQAQARDARAYSARLQPLGSRQLVAASEV
ncbi:hemolysin secretion protein D, partial [Luteimonas sp. SDU101]